MRLIFLMFVAFVSSQVFAQTSFLKDAVAKFDKALVVKDTAVLKQLLHKDLTYGHSNGWVETKQDLIKNLYNGKISYSKVESKDWKWVVTNDIASVRTTTEIKYVLDGKPGNLNLHVLQVWRKSSGRWQLFARQSTKVEEKH